jgi:TBC1 domain family member 25
LFRAYNYSIATNTEPCLNLRIDIKPFSEAPVWETENQMTTSISTNNSNPAMLFQQSQKFVQNKFSGLLMNHMEKTLSSIMQRAMNLVEDPASAPRAPLSDGEFRQYCDSVGQIVHAKELKRVIYAGGIDPSLRRVVWKHLLNLYPNGMTGKDRMDYIKKKSGKKIL